MLRSTLRYIYWNFFSFDEHYATIRARFHKQSSMYFLKRVIRERPLPKESDIANWGGSTLINRLAWSRGVRSDAELDVSLTRLPHFNELDGTLAAAEVIANHIENGNKICIVGDYDADGATSTALVVDFLRHIGVQRLDFMIPDRFTDGYGLKPAMAERIYVSGYDLVITVDNGTSSIEAIANLRNEGVDVVITDHHLASNQLPNANAIVNPNINATPFGAPNLAGVGVAFYTLLALRAELENRGYFSSREKPNMNQWLDLVAIGTVADVVPLDRVNRILVSNGLKRIRANRARTGVKALIAACGRNAQYTTAQDLAFAIAPTLNAVGRLDDMRLGVLCLLESKPQQADEMALSMRSINEDRKQVEQSMVREGLERITDNGRGGIVLYQSDWHEGVLGLVASRIKERFLKPCIAFANSDEKGVIKGSARSVPGVHIRDILVEVNQLMDGALLSFGGHAAAAGVSIPAERLGHFRTEFERVSDRHRQKSNVESDVIWVDGDIPLADFGVEECIELENALPWGQNFPQPLFRQNFIVTSVRPLGRDTARHLALTLRVGDHPNIYNAVFFGFKDKTLEGAPTIEALIGQEIIAVYRPSINRWRGRQQLQLMLDYFEMVDGDNAQ